MGKFKSRRIQINNPPDSGETKWKEFFCYGGKDPEGTCGECQLRFRCFTSRDEDIELPVEQLGHDNIRSVDAESVAHYLIDEHIKVITKDGLKVAKKRYPKVKEFSDIADAIAEGGNGNNL